MIFGLYTCGVFAVFAETDLKWRRRRPGGGSGPGRRPWRVRLPPASARRPGREQLIGPRCRHTRRSFSIECLYDHIYTLSKPGQCTCWLSTGVYLCVREYRYDPSEDTTTHQAAAVTMACPEGLPGRHTDTSFRALSCMEENKRTK